MERFTIDLLEFNSKAYTSLWMIQNKLSRDTVNCLGKTKIPEIGRVMKKPHVYLLRNPRCAEIQEFQHMLVNGNYKPEKLERVSAIDSQRPYAVVCFLTPSGHHGECRLSSKDLDLLDTFHDDLMDIEAVYIVCDSRYSNKYDANDLDMLSREIQFQLHGDIKQNMLFGKLFLSNDKQIPVRIGLCLKFSILHQLGQIHTNIQVFIQSIDDIFFIRSENVKKLQNFINQCLINFAHKRRLSKIVQSMCQHLLEPVDNMVRGRVLPGNIYALLNNRVESKLLDFLDKRRRVSLHKRQVSVMQLRSTAPIKYKRVALKITHNVKYVHQSGEQVTNTNSGQKPTERNTRRNSFKQICLKCSSAHVWKKKSIQILAEQLYFEFVNLLKTSSTTLRSSLVTLTDKLSDEISKTKESLLLHEWKTVSERNSKVKGFGYVGGTVCIYLKHNDRNDETEVSNYIEKYLDLTKYPVDIKFKQLNITPFSKLHQGSKVLPSNAPGKYGTLGLFLEDTKGGYFFTTCAHVIGQSESAYSADDNSKLGDNVFVCDSNLNKDDEIDFSLIQVSPEKNLTCTFGLKALSGDFIKGEIFYGDILEICGCSFYKWGATEPHIQQGKCISFESIGQLLLLNIDNKDFAKSGDSGSIVCIGDDLGVGLAAFVLVGAENDKNTKKTTYAVYKVSDALEKVADIRLDIKPCLKPEIKIIRISATPEDLQTRKHSNRVLEPRP